MLTRITRVLLYNIALYFRLLCWQHLDTLYHKQKQLKYLLSEVLSFYADCVQFCYTIGQYNQQGGLY